MYYPLSVIHYLLAMPDNLSELRKRVSNAPSSPGVYRWLSAKGDVLYVGKAKNLKNRLKSYVQKEADKSIGPWKLSLRKHIADFDVTVTENELEALILETNLIKEVKPKYNVLMKDDKNYVYVRITKETFPHVSIVRRMEDDDAKYFGPYISNYNIKRTLETLHEVFHWKACGASIDAANKGKTLTRACLQYQIGQCNGLCVGDIAEDAYNNAISEVVRFLKGNYTEALKALHDMMTIAAQEKKFEKAAKLRDTLMYIKSLEETQVVSDTSRENTDAVGVALEKGKVHAVVLRERNGKLIDERNIPIAGEKDSIPAIISEFIPQYYSQETDIPDLVLIQEEIDDKAILEEWLKTVREKKTEIRAPERGKKSKLLAMAEANAKQKISQQFAKWEAASKNIETALEELQTVLELPEAPSRIEGYDISHLGGTETVGSMVVMKNGKPANKDYRSFTIKTLKEGEIDDYKALKEVLKRRLLYIVTDITTEEESWKSKGIAFGKARKNEQQAIEQIIEEHPEEIYPCDIDYKDMCVMRTEDTIVGFARMYTHKGGIKELKTLWVDSAYRGSRLGHFLIRKMLKKYPKEKIYITIPPVLESYYSEVGFRYVQHPPAVLQDAMDTASKEGYECEIAMVLLPSERSTDVSLSAKPDLLVIDGGKGQLSSVVEVLKELELTIPVIGLAKREEEVFLPGESFPVDLPNTSQASFLLQRLRNEAHRFANAHREKRLSKGMIGSILDTVPGVGEKTKKDLLRTFGSVSAIAAAEDSELLKVVSPKQLKALREALN